MTTANPAADPDGKAALAAATPAARWADELAELRNDVVETRHRVQKQTEHRSQHLFRPYRPKRLRHCCKKLVKRWPDPGTGGKFSRGVAFSGLPRRLGAAMPEDHPGLQTPMPLFASLSRSSPHRPAVTAAAAAAAAAALQAGRHKSKPKHTKPDATYWMNSTTATSFPRATRDGLKLELTNREGPPMLLPRTPRRLFKAFSTTEIGTRLAPIVPAGPPLSPRMLAVVSGLSSVLPGGSRVGSVFSSSSPTPTSAFAPWAAGADEALSTSSEMKMTKNTDAAVAAAKAAATVALAIKNKSALKLKGISSCFQSVIPRIAERKVTSSPYLLPKETNANYSKAKQIEKRIRDKNRLRSDRKKLRALRAKHKRRFSSLQRLELKFKVRPSWEIPFVIEGTYESPFLGTDHNTRNVTMLSPAKEWEAHRNKQAEEEPRPAPQPDGVV